MRLVKLFRSFCTLYRSSLSSERLEGRVFILLSKRTDLFYSER